MVGSRSKALALSDALAASDLSADVLEGLTELAPDLLGDMIWIAYCRKTLEVGKEESSHG